MSCPNCASWRAAWQARNQADEDRAAELAGVLREVDALLDAMRDARIRAVRVTHLGAASMIRTHELELADIAAQLRGL